MSTGSQGMVAPQSQGTNPGQPPTPGPDPSFDLTKALNEANLADKIKDSKLKEIGTKAIDGYKNDLNSRDAWEQQNDQWMRLACQVMEEKTWPWPGAANIKFPILSTAALQFAARAYPSLISSFDIVHASPIGHDPDGQYATKSQDISTHMSYQLLHEMPDWEEDMDKLTFILPIIGCAFKKTYYSNLHKVNISELVLPKHLVVNYWATKLEDAPRITHELFYTTNEIKERQLAGLFCDGNDYEIITKQAGGSESQERMKTVKDDMAQTQKPMDDDTAPRLILEQHTFLDLDEDGYKEPYVITLDFESGKVLRITARWEIDGIITDDKNKIIRIEPTNYFTKFGFIPNPDGGFYDLGFGLLLGGINDGANTIINQLIDAGTLANLQGGFISKGIRIQQGDMQIMPGQWQQVNNFGDDLKKGIFPLPFKEPSSVLFQLLGMLVQSSKELASISEIMVGKMPGQNTPAATTMATIEQGLKVFTSIYKRIYRSMGREFEKLYRLNSIYMPDHVDFSVIVSGQNIGKSVNRTDYQAMPLQGSTSPGQGQVFVRVIPAADPNMVSETQKLVKSQSLKELIQLGTVNRGQATKQILEAEGQANIPDLMQQDPPQEPPEITIEKMKLQSAEKRADWDNKIELIKIMNDSQSRQSKSRLEYAQAAVLLQGHNLDIAQQQFEQSQHNEAQIFQWAQLSMDSMHQHLDRAAQMQQLQAQQAQASQQPSQ